MPEWLNLVYLSWRLINRHRGLPLLNLRVLGRNRGWDEVPALRHLWVVRRLRSLMYLRVTRGHRWSGYDQLVTRSDITRRRNNLSHSHMRRATKVIAPKSVQPLWVQSMTPE